MKTLNRFLMNLYLLIKQYPLYYFGIIGIFLIFMIYFLIRDRYRKKIIIKKIKNLLAKDPGRALKKLIKSDLDIIDYFLNQNKLKSNEYIKIKRYLIKSEQLREIYNKIINSNNNNSNRERRIKKGISILSRLTVPQAADYLITFLYEDNPEIINMAINGLSNIQTDKVIYSLIEFIKNTSDNKILSNLMETLKKMGTETAEKLIPFIYQTDPTTKLYYINIIGEYQNEKVYHVLSNLLNNDSPEVKIHVIRKLSNYELKDETLNKIITLLEDENWGVRSQAVKTLGTLKLIKTAPFIAGKLTDKSGVVRASAAEALLNLGYEGIKYIFELAKQPEAPEEIKDALKNQDIAFLIEALEHIYQSDREQIKSFSTKLSS